MNREQKMAWLFVVVSVVSVAGYLLWLPFVGYTTAFMAFGVFGLAGLGPVLFRKDPPSDTVSCDERDRIIVHKAALAGAMACFVAIFLLCFIPFGYMEYHGKDTISINYLPQIAWISGMVLWLVRSIVLLVLYGRGVRNDSSGATEG